MTAARRSGLLLIMAGPSILEEETRTNPALGRFNHISD
jgi:RimJ/RimL family protein N-acetyltransferase